MSLSPLEWRQRSEWGHPYRYQRLAFPAPWPSRLDSDSSLQVLYLSLQYAAVVPHPTVGLCPLQCHWLPSVPECSPSSQLSRSAAKSHRPARSQLVPVTPKSFPLLQLEQRCVAPALDVPSRSLPSLTAGRELLRDQLSYIFAGAGVSALPHAVSPRVQPGRHTWGCPDRTL